MSLGGIIVAIGDMVDAAIVMVDNAHKRLEDWERDGRKGERLQVLIDSAKEVGPPIFASVLVIAISFIPIFALEAQEGRMFKPLAWTNNLAIAMCAVLAITLVPACLPTFIRGKIFPEQKHPVSRSLQRLYAPLLRWTLVHRGTVVALAIGTPAEHRPGLSAYGLRVHAASVRRYDPLYMPTTLPGLSVTEASRLLQMMDQSFVRSPRSSMSSAKRDGRRPPPTRRPSA